MLQDYRGASLDVSYDKKYKASIHRYAALDEIPWEDFSNNPGKNVRIIVSGGGELLLDVLYVPTDNKNLLVSCHGALIQSSVDKPYFQFVSSFKGRNESLLFLFDSTMNFHEELYSCYAIDSPLQDLTTQYADLINSLRDAVSIDRTLVVGHSGGGTTALRIGSRVPNSRAIAGNPVVPDEKYTPTHFKKLQKHVFPDSETLKGMVGEYSQRLWLMPWLETRVSSSTFTWFVHKNDPSIVSNYAAVRAAERLGVSGEIGGNTPQGDALTVCNWQYPRNPHNMPRVEEKNSFLPFIESTLGEQSKFSLEILGETDPQWH